MGGSAGLGVLVVLVGVASLLLSCQCQDRCGGTDGRAGQDGAPGRDGWPGVKGEKGEPAVMADGLLDDAALLRLRGETGSRGSQGVMGPPGFRGDVGTPGQPGIAGKPGEPGRNLDEGQASSQQDAYSAFSVIRTLRTYPRYEQVITYDTVVVNNPNDFDAGAGQFTCRAPGVYYFTFHSVARVSMCIRISSDALAQKLGFCDYNRNADHVLSGGVVLQLAVGQKVWLESFEDQQAASVKSDQRDKQIIFNGFRLF